MAVYNDIARAIGRPKTYVPLLDVAPDGSTVWELWASGFGRALDLRPWAWSGFNDMAEDDIDAGPFRLLNALSIAADDPASEELHEDLEALLQEGAEGIIGSAIDRLNRMRLAGLKAELQPKAGRNDPCPCGSGKKYKKCCLQAETH